MSGRQAGGGIVVFSDLLRGLRMLGTRRVCFGEIGMLTSSAHLAATAPDVSGDVRE